MLQTTKEALLSQAKLKELLHYDPETGEFTRLVRVSNQKAGVTAGYLNNRGYIQIKVDGKLYSAHRLAWLYVHGKFPDNDIDHINRVKDDNRIVNLRDVTCSQNQWNTVARRNGLKGVTYHKRDRRWQAVITTNKKKKYLDYFDTELDAHEAYCRAADKYHGKYANYGWGSFKL